MQDNFINTIIGQSPTIAALIFFIYFLIKEKRNTVNERNKKEDLQNELEKEFRAHMQNNTERYLTIIQINSEAMNRISLAMEKFSANFDYHTKNKKKPE